MTNSSIDSFEEDTFMDAVDSEPINVDDNSELYPLHRAVFERKSCDHISKLLESGQNVAQKDLHGNTPLHLAVMLGQKEIIDLLLQHNAPIKSRNLQGWTPLDEAISYGDRKTIKIILKMGRKQARQTMDSRRPKLIEALRLIQDFQIELRWEFYSWIPLVKRFLPSDTCKITKKGSSIRLDTTLLDFSDRSWQRGNITFLFVGEKKPSQALVILDNELKVYQYIRYNESMDIEEDIDLLMSSDIIYPQMSTKSITFSRTQTGWFFSRYNKTEKVGNFDADFYNINGLTIETKKRREHLSEEDVQSNKALYETLKGSLDTKANKLQLEQSNDDSVFEHNLIGDGSSEKNNDIQSSQCTVSQVDHRTSSNNSEKAANGYSAGDDKENNDDDDDDDDDGLYDSQLIVSPNDPVGLHSVMNRRKSLPPPALSSATWADYMNAPKGCPPCLGRTLKSKESLRTFKATLAMSQEFPLTIESLLNVLEVVAPFKHFKKLREFIKLNLPPGFPVKIDIPVVPTVLARVTFLNFEFLEKISDTLFDIPSDYTEDPNRFPEI